MSSRIPRRSNQRYEVLREVTRLLAAGVRLPTPRTKTSGIAPRLG